MTAEAFIQKCNIEFGLSRPWPKSIEVDSETYTNCCRYLIEKIPHDEHKYGYTVTISLTPNKRIIIRGMELVEKK